LPGFYSHSRGRRRAFDPHHLKEGWQIAGYSQAFERSTFILFRHPDQAYLVQCRVGYDVTRKPPTYSI
jgi:hypothetical protein